MTFSLAQRLPADINPGQPGIVRQGVIQRVQLCSQRFRRAAVLNNQQGRGAGIAIAKHHGLTRTERLNQLTLQPLRADIATKTGNQQILGTTVHRQETLWIPGTQVTGIQPLIPGRFVAQIAKVGVATHQNVAPFIHPDPNMGKRFAHRPLAFAVGYVQCDHRTALGKPVTLVKRQAGNAAPGQQIG